MELYQWQKDELSRVTDPKRCIAADPRTGKTRYAALALKTINPKFAVVTSPLSVCSGWVRELELQGMPVLRGFEGSVASVQELLKSKPYGVLVINDDRLLGLYDDLVRMKPEAIVGDECHRFKSPGSGRGRAFRKLCQKAPWGRIMSGTIVTKHHGDLWGQFVALDREAFYPSYFQFCRRYLLLDHFKRPIGTVNLEELMQKVNNLTTFVKREDVFGPDQYQTCVRELELPAKARKIYDDLAKRWVSEVDAHTISTDHLITKFMRFQQITAGFFVDDEKTIHDLHSVKIDAILADLEDILAAGENAVIFHKFSWEGEAYAGAISKRFSCRVVRINGSTSPDEREVATRYINEQASSTVAVVQTQAGGVGISLAGATHAMFSSQLFSYDDEKQARDRIYSPGRTRCISYYRMNRTIDTYIAEVLSKKQNIHQAVTKGDYKSVLYGKA